MVHRERERCPRRHPGAEVGVERKADVLHARDLLVGLPPGFEHTGDARIAADFETDVPVDADESLELLADPALVVDRDEQRAR